MKLVHLLLIVQLSWLNQCVLSTNGVVIRYRDLVERHSGQLYYELGYLRSLRTIETQFGDSYQEDLIITKDVQLAPNKLMNYECENPNATLFYTSDSHITSYTQYDLMPTAGTGFSIDAWVYKDKKSIGGAIVSSWGLKSRRYKLYFDNANRLSFAYSESTDKRAPFRMCTAAQRILLDQWNYIVVKYEPTEVVGEQQLQFWVNNAPITDYLSTEGCNRIRAITSAYFLPVTIGASYDGGDLRENFAGMLMKIAFYNRPLTQQEMSSHFDRGSEESNYNPPCNRNGDCALKGSGLYCVCNPQYFGVDCSKDFQVLRITPNTGSYFGGTNITVHLKGINANNVSIRIGPNPTDPDAAFLPPPESQPYGGCYSPVVQDQNTIVCTTEFAKTWEGRGPQLVSVVYEEIAAWGGKRYVFSKCQDKTLSQCMYYPLLERTPRVWAYPRWATPGTVLKFIGQYFTYQPFQLSLVSQLECPDDSCSVGCELQTSLPYTDTTFSCKLNSVVRDTLLKGYFDLSLVMAPNGFAWPLEKSIYLHPNVITIYPYYPVDSKNPHCPTDGVEVTIYSDTLRTKQLKENEIRIYETRCTQRRVDEMDWLIPKVTDEFWKSFYYDRCPPQFTGDLATFIPEAYTTTNTFKTTVSYAVEYTTRRQRRFVDHRGRSYCLIMEEDL